MQATCRLFAPSKPGSPDDMLLNVKLNTIADLHNAIMRVREYREATLLQFIFDNDCHEIRLTPIGT